VIWSVEARRELPARARGRRLLLDYFATRCCGRGVSVGDVDLRWAGPAEPGGEFLALRGPVGLDAYIQRDLVPIMEAARGRVVMRGWGRFRHPVVEFEDGAVWLSFVGQCPTRSPLHH
jgi:hypothetical protein